LYDETSDEDKELFEEMERYERKITDCYMAMSIEGQAFVNSKRSSPAPMAGVCSP
jgi:hypothetical protein